MDDLELIKQKINVVDLIQEYLPLKKAGVNFKANCPFHQEKSPSFMVSPERGIWHCFGCQKGGDIFKFLMEKEGVEFREALEILAKKAGVTISNTHQVKKDAQERLFELNEKARQYFSYILLEHPLGKPALDYLKKRGVTDETIKTFGLGYAPLSWESLSNFLKKRSFTTQEIIEVGLGVPSKRGCYDRFRGRIMFPLTDVRDRILGFSGRILDQGEPKYINSPQTLIFDKSRFLFGIHLSKTAIRDKKTAILVEGEMDMIMSYQSGVKNIVATKGTAFTEQQIELLKRYSEILILCFDTDLAGDVALRRGIELADKAGMNMKVLKVQGAKDPAELCLKDPEGWKAEVKNAVPIYDYYLESVQNRYSLKDAAGKRAIFNEILPIWKKITDPIMQDHYIQKLSALLQVKDDLIRKQINTQTPKLARPARAITKPVQTIRKTDKLEFKDRKKLLEEYLVALLLHIPEESTYIPNFPETLFSQEYLRQMYVLLVLYLDSIAFQGQAFRIVDFVKNAPEELTPEIDRLYLLEIDEKLLNSQNWQKELELVITELKRILIKSSLEKLSLQIKSAQEFDKMETLASLNRKFRDLSLKLKNL